VTSRHKAILLVAGFLILLVILAVSGVAASPSRQDPEFVYVVTTTEDHNDGACDGDCSLRDAIIAANQSQFDDAILLPSGTYTLTLEGSDEDGALTGDLDITSNLTIIGEGAETTIIDAGGMTGDPDRVLDIDPARLGGYDVNLWGLTITGGYAASGAGGGVRNSGADVTVQRCAISGNLAGYGGGMYCDAGSMRVYDSTLSGNSAPRGGGVHNSGADVTVRRCAIRGNLASYGGGGMCCDAGSMRVYDSTLSGNSAPRGGGVLVEQDALLRVENSTISGNSASDVGAGIRNASATTHLYNSTVSENSADHGASGIDSTGMTAMTNTLVANNAPGTDCNGAPRSCGHNLDSDGSCHLSAEGDLPNTDPKLGPLQDNGGPTFTHALLFGSPAMDAGDNSACPATDQRGFVRPMDGDGDGTATCDIGAFEHLGLRARLPLVFNSYGPAP
jgi:CSLREA domain-containing protein